MSYQTDGVFNAIVLPLIKNGHLRFEFTAMPRRTGDYRALEIMPANVSPEEADKLLPNVEELPMQVRFLRTHICNIATYSVFQKKWRG